MKKIQMVYGDNISNFKSDLEKYLSEGYIIIQSNMTMMNTNVVHRPAFYALLQKEVV